MTTLSDADLRAALAPYRQVHAPRRLLAPASPSPRRSRRSRVVIVGVAAAAAAVAVGTVLTIEWDRPDVATSPAPLDISDAEAVVFTDGTTVDIDELYDVANHERLRELFAEHGAELVIVERPVAPAADGRVYSVRVSTGAADELAAGRIHLDAGDRVEVEVGRGDPAIGSEGLTLYELFPAIPEAVDREDPAATGQALEQLGFAVHWVLIEAPGEGHDVETPPPGTVVISVAGPNGEWDSIDPKIDTLMVEVAAPATAAALGH